MKTLIIYTSKYGYTEDMVKKMVSESNSEFDAVDIGKNGSVDLSKYDGVILGGSVYIGQINGKLKSFINKHMDTLLTKKVGLFLSCGSEENFDAQVKSNFPEILVKHASTIVYLGGMIQKEKLNFFYKFIIDKIEKSPEGMKPYVTYPNRTLDIVNEFYRA